jgi:hypothetical protein
MRLAIRLAGPVAIAAVWAFAVPAAHSAPPPAPAAPPAAPAPLAGGPTRVQEVFSPDGTIKRVRVPAAEVTGPATAFSAKLAAPVTALQNTGPSNKRYDLVFVGDGYTAAQLPAFRKQAAEKWAAIAAVEPFKTYKNSFNVWLVDVVSAQSGVDNDPTLGINRDTALGMRFWCANTERLLCVNTATALSYAASAPGADQVIAIANTTKYGGAGGTVATASGGNASSGQIMVHELGHSIGGLADEYTYPNDQYTGAEPKELNASKLANGSKWASYLGKATPDGGVIGAFEGGRYYAKGLYRPSENSLMRTLGKPFNLIGHDVMVAAIKKKL